jgi:hypothetical protein
MKGAESYTFVKTPFETPVSVATTQKDPIYDIDADNFQLKLFTSINFQ